ncbi:LuxR family transcriptional regulator [Streptomyces sp. NPDC001941]|uniref:LuxR family transcriptional regulator n=1 Tax=Streptomyces sp. NPDC001941 TaxID=3154659 RepID=UPI00331CBACA
MLMESLLDTVRISLASPPAAQTPRIRAAKLSPCTASAEEPSARPADPTQCLYAHLLAEGPLQREQMVAELRLPPAAVDQALRRLQALQLAEYCTTMQAYRAVPPDVAQLSLSQPLQEEILRRNREIAQVHTELSPYAEAFEEHRRLLRREQSILRHRNPATAARLLTEAIRVTSSPVLVMQPLGAEEAAPESVLPAELLAAGDRLRLLLPHTARTRTALRPRLQGAQDAGADIRTAGYLLDSLILVDGYAALVPDPTAPAGTTATTVVYEPSLLALLRKVFDNSWQSATDFDGDSSGYGEALDEMRAAILELLATGLKDEVVARRIGMSARTFRRHMASLMEELHAISRFQAGVAAAQAGLVSAEAAEAKAV